jgi:hypothetical protein
MDKRNNSPNPSNASITHTPHYTFPPNLFLSTHLVTNTNPPPTHQLTRKHGLCLIKLDAEPPTRAIGKANRHVGRETALSIDLTQVQAHAASGARTRTQTCSRRWRSGLRNGLDAHRDKCAEARGEQAGAGRQDDSIISSGVGGARCSWVGQARVRRGKRKGRDGGRWQRGHGGGNGCGLCELQVAGADRRGVEGASAERRLLARDAAIYGGCGVDD